MTDLLDTAVVAAGMTLLQADSLLTVYDSNRPTDAPRPYVLVYPVTSRPDPAGSNALDGLSRTLDVRLICHCVGDTRESTTAVAQRVRTALLDQIPVIPGHPTAVAGLVKQQSDSTAPNPDRTIGDLIFDEVVIYHFRVTI
jgi:hypothetical protein